jgi:hypothetical protein
VCRVYSSKSTCYEILTSCISFENLKSNDYDVVLGGGSPELPAHLSPWICTMLERCWHPNPFGLLFRKYVFLLLKDVGRGLCLLAHYCQLQAFLCLHRLGSSVSLV